MNELTIQQVSPAVLPPIESAQSLPLGELRYAVINARTGRCLDWVAVVGMSKYYGVPKDPLEFWQVYRLRATGHETILLDAQTFYRARLFSGQHLRFVH